jgi:hypothetical protein
VVMLEFEQTRDEIFDRRMERVGHSL